MSEDLFAYLIATTTGLLLITAVMQVWRQSLTASIRLLAVQGRPWPASLPPLASRSTAPRSSVWLSWCWASKPWPCPGRWCAPPE